MTCGHEQSVSNRGRYFRLCRRGVEEALKGTSPGRVVKYGVDIRGMEYPVRQVVAEATRTPRIEWTTSNAYRILQNLGFEMRVH